MNLERLEPADARRDAVKRAVDILVSSIMLLPTALIILVLGLAIRLDSSGPALFGQLRVGRNGRLFSCYKLRTMRAGAPEAGTHEVPAEFVTRIGRLIRKTKLDELPQFWNVLIGDMSIVGPRPSLPTQTHLIALRQRKGVLRALPGITGLAQVSHVDMSQPERLADLDAHYLQIAGFWQDLKIMLMTVMGGSPAA
jgi:O-antigen biosynthesis protein WbqP